MNIALILASGQGSRVKTSKIPKQFIEINDKPIVAHTIDHFIVNKNIDYIVVACHPEWINYLEDYLKENSSSKVNKCFVIKGGENRNKSIENSLNFVAKKIKPNDNDIILTHDAVRMFVSDRVINENIEMCKKYDAVDTVVPAIDTIVTVQNGHILDIPDRNIVYNGQTPQTFKYKILKELYLNHKNEDTSDICKLLSKYSKTKIHVVIGEYENFKITTDLDLDYVKKLVRKND